MREPLRIALAQINTIPADLPGNRQRILESWSRARDAGAHLVVTPELALAGYCPRDLLFRKRFVEAAAAALEELAAATATGPALLVGTVLARTGPGRPLWNAAAWLADGRVQGTFRKRLLPVYDVFDEARYFEPGPGDPPVALRGWRVGVTICEDLWVDRQGRDAPGYVHDPARDEVAGGADVLVNLSASPFHLGKSAERERLVVATAGRLGRPVLLCNVWGGNDEILFDGCSLAVDERGRVAARGAKFAEDLVLVDLPVAAAAGAAPADPIGDLRAALVLGIRDYARKCGFDSIVIGLSGGIDSALCAALAVDALGAGRVQGVAMPSRFSSPESVEDALALAASLGIRCAVVPIEPSYRELVAAAQQVVGEGPFGVMEENIQARIRGSILMAVSNRTGALLITTGNKSELAVGYCTLYGDMCGGLAAISDVFKTDVYRVARPYCERGAIPWRSFHKAPSAELRPNQTDQDTLPPYDVLDRILALHLEEGLGTRDILEQQPALDAALVDRVLSMVARSEYKRKQAAPGLKVSRKAFGQGRRVPLVASALSYLDRPAPEPASGSRD